MQIAGLHDAHVAAVVRQILGHTLRQGRDKHPLALMLDTLFAFSEVFVCLVLGRMDGLLGECKKRIEHGERVLVTTLTKRMAEDLTDYCCNMGVKARYLHSDIDTLERLESSAPVLGEFDVLVGINLLREGLDIPEVSLVCILDADKEGFLRSTGSLIQTFGRAARNTHGQVILYADTVTDSMKKAMDETNRRRAKQIAYNEERHITPRSTKKSMDSPLDAIYEESKASAQKQGRGGKRGKAEEAPRRPKRQPNWWQNLKGNAPQGQGPGIRASWRAAARPHPQPA